MRYHDEWTTARIERTEDLTPSIRLFELAPAGAIRSWRAGAHLRVRLDIGGRTETRTYSLLDTGVEDGLYRIAVKRIEDGLGGSRAMWALAPGESIAITQPHNDFELNLQAGAYTLVAAGVGITPLLGMAHFLARSGRPLQFHYAASSRAETAFADLLQTWLGERLHLCISGEGRRLDIERIVAATPVDGELYVCGPIGLLEAVRRAWAQAGRAAGNLRYESFASSGHYANRPFTAVLPRYGVELQVPAHQSLLAALEEAGIDVLSDCRRGECGLCTLDILACDSPIDHRDVFLSDEQKSENRRLCACVSRPAGGRIEIDTNYRGGDGAAIAATTTNPI